MKSNRIKMVVIVLIALTLFFGGVFYYASTKLKPEEIKKLTIEQTKKIFPKAEITLQSVNIDWGFNFNINLEKLALKTSKENHSVEMMSVEQLVIKVPLWAILTGSGIIDVRLDAPLMNYHEFAEGNNWTYAMGDKASEPKSEEPQKQNKGNASSSSSSSALGIFGKSKINVKLSDVAVKYSRRDNSKGEIKISRFLIKGLNFESSTAFEIASSANFVMKDKSVVGFDTIVIGEFNVADLVKNGSVSSLVIIKLNNISKTGLDWKFPEITTNIDLLLKKDGELSGKLATSFESQNKMSAQFKITKQVEISDLNAEIVLKDIATIMGLDKAIDLSKAKLKASGNIVYGEDKKINANIGFAISPGVIYSKEGIVASTTVAGDFKGKDLSVKVKTDVLDGTVTTSLSGVYDPNEKFEMAKLKPFDIRVVANGMKIPEKLIRSKLWDKKPVEATSPITTVSSKADKAAEKAEKAEAVSSAEVPSNGTSSAMGLPPSNVNIEWSNLNIGGEDFSGRGRIITSLSAMAVDNLNFKFSKGTGKLSQTMNLGKNSSDSKFNFELNNLNLSSFKAFLPPFVENFSGNFTGKVTGAATIYKATRSPVFDVTVIADAKKGELKKLNISDYINPLLANIPVVKDKMKDKQLKIDGNFETLTMKGRFTNSQYTISAFDFVGIDNKVQVSGSGDIYPVVGSSNLSTMEVNFVDNTGKISDVLQANVGSKVLPMRLTGPGFSLKPDYNYTISKMAKGALKTKGQEKLKEVIDKNIDKIVPAAAKEKVKGILDGFFKKK
ncbi:MAG: hypothetical protein KBD76_12135 [Bacteriovorax sp.]|nr:hypothetical protein [Bacteriovorax sp.]